MNLKLRNLRIAVEKDNNEEYIKAASLILEIGPENIKLLKTLNKSLDARDKTQFYYEIAIAVSVPDTFANKDNLMPYNEYKIEPREQIKLADRPIIIGFGPAGIFAALELIDHGIKPIIFERGKKIEERAIDVNKFIKEGTLNPESNIQFGEGGAGSFSDGKLFSRLRNSDYLRKVLYTFIKFGAPDEISYLHKPHLGTDVLCKVVHNMREYILSNGGEIHYNSRMTDMIIDDDKISGIVINGEKEYRSSLVYLAIGHSARDTFEMIYKKGVKIEQKAIAVGVRLEHPAETINFIRYGHKYKNVAALGAAAYSFNYTDKKIERGAYTFCMCPGGEI
ncbi:MAG: dehydrogenase, partial [Elusimicrobiota bacterium]|nr:dehydrogenase [Elusimicrobiota bacterium]